MIFWFQISVDELKTRIVTTENHIRSLSGRNSSKHREKKYRDGLLFLSLRIYCCRTYSSAVT
jgi:hypothetical protein